MRARMPSYLKASLELALKNLNEVKKGLNKNDTELVNLAIVPNLVQILSWAYHEDIDAIQDVLDRVRSAK